MRPIAAACEPANRLTELTQTGRVPALRQVHDGRVAPPAKRGQLSRGGPRTCLRRRHYHVVCRLLTAVHRRLLGDTGEATPRRPALHPVAGERLRPEQPNESPRQALRSIGGPPRRPIQVWAERLRTNRGHQHVRRHTLEPDAVD